jgi:hypothetical protein
MKNPGCHEQHKKKAHRTPEQKQRGLDRKKGSESKRIHRQAYKQRESQ